jgi:hypothetical protein
MVTRLVKHTKDPNDLGRGPGYYYLRGGVSPSSKSHTYKMPNGTVKTINGPYYSKYSVKRDEAKLSKGSEIHKIGIPKKIANEYAHITDGNLERYFKQKWL